MQVKNLFNRIKEGPVLRGVSRVTSAIVDAINAPLVVIAADTTVAAAADQAVTVYGLAKGSGASGATIEVTPLLAEDVFWMRYIGTWDDALVEDYVGLDVSVAGVQTVNVDDTTNKLFKLLGRVLDVDGTYWAVVTVPTTLSQAVTEIS